MEKIEEIIVRMHHECAMRDNASSNIIKAMAQLGKPFNDAVAAGLLSMGGKHAPVREAQDLFIAWRDDLYNNGGEDTFELPAIVPGFGSAWYKKEKDPVIEKCIDGVATWVDGGAELTDDLDAYTNYVRERTGKDIYPNAAMATALVNIAMKYPSFIAMSHVIQGRIAAWESIYVENFIDRGF